MLVSSGTGPLLALLFCSFIIRIAVRALAVAVTLVGLYVVIIHEVDCHFSLGGPLPALALLRLLLHQALLLLPGLLGGLGLLVNYIFINQGIIEFISVHSVVVGKEVVNIVASILSILLGSLNLLELSAVHFLGGLHAVERGRDILLVVQAGSSENGLVLLG